LVKDTDIDFTNTLPVIPKGISEGNKRLLGRQILDPGHLPPAIPLAKRLKLVQPDQQKRASKNDTKKYRERIKTYKEGEGQELPGEISSNYLSRFGWVNNNNNIICRNCENRLLATTGSIKEQIQMFNGHSGICSSRDYKLPYSILFLPVPKAQLVLADIKILMHAKSKSTEYQVAVNFTAEFSNTMREHDLLIDWILRKIEQKKSTWSSNYLKLIFCGFDKMQSPKNLLQSRSKSPMCQI
jgi:hypothetical protein